MTQGDAKRQFKAGVCGQSGVVAVEAASSRSFGRHTHDQFGIGVVIRGAQDSASGRGEVRATSGNMITVNPNEVHDGRPVAGEARAWRMLYLDPALIAQFSKAMGHSTGVEFIHPVLNHQPAAIAFGRLYTALTKPGQEPWQELVEQELFQILPSLLGHIRSTQMKLLSKELAQAKARIDAHPEVPVSLTELAAEAGLSRFHFLRAFKAATHLPPHAYRLQRQLQMARRLIMTGYTVLQASHLAGFADQSHLTRHFVSNYGLTPGALSHSLRAQHLPAL
ncbi:AraC family transcriptional regulator [Paraburkholderia hayleyella]|uniref:AraC family transcriptional regulator n=1 Tax=Paraburkholderia hayleyella TaxID=2152889 RepID=UPI001291E980|nr:AraC family transcriptional regulator [Paraburkholderia hayleyella]